MRHPGSKPLVSVGMPVYNGQRYVAAAIEAHLSQTFRDFELVISDNASTDATRPICERYARLDRRIRYVRQDRNIGANRNHEFVFRDTNQSAPFFRWAACDDIPDASLLAHCVEHLEKQPRVVAVIPEVRNIDSEGRVISHRERTLDLPTDDVGKRVQAVLAGNYQMVFDQGLMRRSTLAPRAHRRNYFGWDFVLLLELALAGRILQPPGPALARRFHAGAASHVRSMSGLKAWVDPTLRARFLMPHWRLSFERTVTVLGSDLSLSSRALVLLQVLRHAWWTRVELFRDVGTGLALATGRTDEVSF
jgi:hypothetical protein